MIIYCSFFHETQPIFLTKQYSQSIEPNLLILQRQQRDNKYYLYFYQQGLSQVLLNHFYEHSLMQIYKLMAKFLIFIPIH